ncbi:alpha/beta fold hydrolase [Streptomyces sp. NBC_00687]|uniref:alpha/beta fold hydrolase n=1 Tax=Streptomyces sp. NBC_00687 TaxID=2975807 RepID=UPI002253A826|nr:alpha/beta hydrolase [Streptomyces sp. NBC_00687]MCX4911999.1 alpha/beta hydrolase [Streptomyces sp. NBC_00687]
MNRTPAEPPSENISESDSSEGSSRKPSRRTVIVGLVATTAVAALIGGLALAATGAAPKSVSSSTSGGEPAVPTGDAASQAGKFGSVSTSPNLSAEFKKTFSDHYVEANGIRQHAVIGGEGPPLLLVHGWPENWYAWRLMMPALARNHTVIAVDQRGIGLTEKPKSGYDTRTLANDQAALMDKLGYKRFSLVGHDTGMIISYALAADHPDRVSRVALAEVPGPPTLKASPPLFIDSAHNDRLWHIPFNRVDNELTEKLVKGRESTFFGYEFDIQGGKKKLPDYAREYYFQLFSDPATLRGGFGLYRAWDAILEQNAQREKTKLPMPVLAIGGEESYGPAVGAAMKPLAKSVQSVVIPGVGHWVAEQAPAKMVAVLNNFLDSAPGVDPEAATSSTAGK